MNPSKNEPIALNFQTFFGFSLFTKSRKIHDEAAFEAFLCFLPTKDPCQLNRFSLTDKGRTQVTLNKVKSKYHSSLAIG